MSTSSSHHGSEAIARCYDLLDIMRLAGITDLTEGIYTSGNPFCKQVYLAAQRRQADYLLDEIRCSRGTHILDVGCGYGPLLSQAKQRGATSAVGITLSAPQARYCKKHGLDAIVMNYWDIPSDWNALFTGVIANGSLEHFAQVEDAVAGNVDVVYRRMFQIVHRILKPGCRFATTAIHYRERGQADPCEVAKGPSRLPRGSDAYYFAWTQKQIFGGWLPEPGQFERCANGLFRLVREEDGTRDYHLTSEYWLRAARRHLICNPRVWIDLLCKLRRETRATMDMLRYIFIDQAWMWQFRGANPPTRLYRHTWEAVP